MSDKPQYLIDRLFKFGNLSAKRVKQQGFSSSSNQQLFDELVREFNGDSDRARLCVRTLVTYSLCTEAILPPPDTRSIRERLLTTGKAAKRLRIELERLGVDEIEYVSAIATANSDEALHSGFVGTKVDDDNEQLADGTYLALRENLRAFEWAIGLAVSRISVTKGRRRNEKQIVLARFTCLILENFGISLSTYDDGIYMRILQILFEECFPGIGKDAHRRYGIEALKSEWPDTLRDF
jgi:hypothetical protein